MDLETRDPEFVKKAKQFIVNLKKTQFILPFPRAWVPKNHKLVGFVSSMDGGKMAFGVTIHSLAGTIDCQQSILKRNVAMTKSKISKRNVPAHECLA